MKPSRRSFLQWVACAAALPALPGSATGQSYPSGPIRIILGAAPGGSPDIQARLIGEWLSKRLAQPVVVENRVGAGTNIATEAVVRSAPDGHTLLMMTAINTWNAALYDNLNFDFIRDIAPVAGLNRQTFVMLVSPSIAASTVPEFIAYAKANPGRINMASSGAATAGHVTGELFKMMAGLDMVHVPYRGSPAALTALLTGEAHVTFDPIPTAIEYARSGRLRALGVTSLERAQALPDLPTVSEFVHGFEAVGWQGLGVPKGTPDHIIERLNQEVNAGLADPAIRGRIENLGATVFSCTPAELGKLVAADTEKWAKVVAFSGIKVK